MYQQLISRIFGCRGEPSRSIAKLKDLLGNKPVLKKLERLFKLITNKSKDLKINLKLDPTFQPHFELYTGLVFQLVCQGSASPVVIASGGRYDDLVSKIGGKCQDSAGVGFGFAIDEIRELPTNKRKSGLINEKVLIGYNSEEKIETAFKKQSELHKEGIEAVVEFIFPEKAKEAEELMRNRNCNKLELI